MEENKQKQIEAARNVLEHYGYYVGSLWCLLDIQENYECDDKAAYEILDRAIEVNMENVWESIHAIAEDMNLTKK